MNIDKMILTNYNNPKKPLRKLKGIVIHWTANTSKGANAVANRNYFNNLKPNGNATRFASAHYCVDDKHIVQCIEDMNMAYHVGANKYTALGDSLREKPYSPNYYFIGIEMCVNSDGDWNKTYQNTLQLVVELMKKYKLTIDQIYRHYDITGKDCPKMMVDEKAWSKFKDDVIAWLVPPTPLTQTVLMKGSKGENVVALQKYLLKLGYDLGKYGADGDFGITTEKQVILFQKQYGLLESGIVGSKMWKILLEKCAIL